MNCNIAKHCHLLFFFKEIVQSCSNVSKTAKTANQNLRACVSCVSIGLYFCGFVIKLHFEIKQMHRYSNGLYSLEGKKSLRE